MSATVTSTAFRKTVRIGTIPDPAPSAPRRRMDVFVRIEYTAGRLSLSGVEGPKENGDARGSAGQIVMGYAHRDPADNDARYDQPTTPADFVFAPGWDAERWLDLVDVWERWHNNDLRPGCEHQHAAGWDRRPIDPDKPTTAYGKHFEGQRSASWNLLGWIRPEEHPEGLLGKPCPECGYRYGTAWMREEVPASVLEFLAALPDTDKQPAWF